MNKTEQARLLYTLLEAAEDENRLHDPAIAKKWNELKARFDYARCEDEHAALDALLTKLDRAGAFVGTWIQDRWLALKLREIPDLGLPKTRRHIKKGRAANH